MIRAAEAEGKLAEDAARMIRESEPFQASIPTRSGDDEQLSREIDAVRRAFPRDLSDEETIEQVVATFARNRAEIERFFRNKKTKLKLSPRAGSHAAGAPAR